jgi:hypothetical protein
MRFLYFNGLLMLTTAFLSSTCYGKALEMHSPDGKIRFEFQLTDSCPTYSVWYANTPLIVASPLTLVFRGSENSTASSVIGPALQTLGPTYREDHDQYTLPIGRNSSVDDRFNEYDIPLQEPSSSYAFTMTVSPSAGSSPGKPDGKATNCLPRTPASGSAATPSCWRPFCRDTPPPTKAAIAGCTSAR